MCRQVASYLKRSIANEQDQQVFHTVFSFNKHVLKTNFFKAVKVALSFRLNPAFLAGLCTLSQRH